MIYYNFFSFFYVSISIRMDSIQIIRIQCRHISNFHVFDLVFFIQDIDVVDIIFINDNQIIDIYNEMIECNILNIKIDMIS